MTKRPLCLLAILMMLSIFFLDELRISSRAKDANIISTLEKSKQEVQVIGNIYDIVEKEQATIIYLKKVHLLSNSKQSIVNRLLVKIRKESNTSKSNKSYVQSDSNSKIYREEKSQEKAIRGITIKSKIAQENTTGEKDKIKTTMDKGTLTHEDRSLGQLPELRIGNEIHLLGSMSTFLSERNPGGFNERAYYKGKGIYGYLVPEQFVGVGEKYLWLEDYLFHVIEKFQNSIYQITTKEKGDIFSAMLIGDKNQLDQEVKWLYQIAGITHILTISGVKTPNLVSHITVVIGLKWAFVRVHIAKKYIQNLCFKGHNRIPCHPRFRGGDFQTNNLAKGLYLSAEV